MVSTETTAERPAPGSAGAPAWDDALLRKVQIKPVLSAAMVPAILGYASELREVFTNLILNAVDAMPQGGRLELSCRKEHDRVVAAVQRPSALTLATLGAAVLAIAVFTHLLRRALQRRAARASASDASTSIA